jgi:hypothetical protein
VAVPVPDEQHELVLREKLSKSTQTMKSKKLKARNVRERQTNPRDTKLMDQDHQKLNQIKDPSRGQIRVIFWEFSENFLDSKLAEWGLKTKSC